MSGIFQGYTNSNGRVRASQVTAVPAGSANDRGMIVAGNRVIPYLVDAGQPRVFHDGIAFDEVTGLLLAGRRTATPLNVSMGGLLVDANGAVVLEELDAQVIHQGVGLRNDGALAAEAEPIATFIAHLSNNVASTAGPGTFTRASEGLYQGANGNWRVAPDNEPRFENGQLLIEPASTNKCEIYNASPDESLTGYTSIAEGIMTRVLDAPAAFANVGNGFSVDLDCTGVGAGRVTMDGPVGNTNTHTLSAWVRKISGAGATLLQFHPAGDSRSFSNSDWQQVHVTDLTPGATQVGSMYVSAGARARIYIPQVEELRVVSSPIITQGAAASRALDQLTYANADQFFEQTQGMALITMRPQFDKAELATLENLLTVSSAVKSNLLYYDTSFRSTDGTNTAAVVTPAYVKNDEIKVAAVYGPAGASALQVGYSLNGAAWVWSTAVAYDGGFAIDNILAIVASVGIPVKVSNVRLYNENKGTAWIEANY